MDSNTLARRETDLHPQPPRPTSTFPPAQQPGVLPDRRPIRRQTRPRPNELLEKQYAGPPSPLKQIQPRSSSKMSLFSLFSKPKVERARGHSEPTQQIAKTVLAPERVMPSQPKEPLYDPLERTPSVLSHRTVAPRASSRFRVRPTAPPAEAKPAAVPERKPAQWEPPPLFQAYPQCTKSGVLHVPAEPSMQRRTTVRKGSEAPSRESNNGQDGGEALHPTIHNLPRKIFLLVTSGYLLQYAETGASDRLPEKILPLGQNSATFACDLVPGQHYVLQVSQSVDSVGVVAVVNGGSIFRKLGIRGQVARRTTPNILLVMPNAAEFEGWMTAIRARIEALGGRMSDPDTAVPSKTVAVTSDLTRVPDQSHRYQVRRHPSRISVISSAVSVESAPAIDLPPVPANSTSHTTDAAMPNDTEYTVSPIEEGSTISPSKGKEDVDSRSFTSSSTGVSSERHNSNSLHHSRRISMVTTPATLANSRTNSSTSLSATEPSSKSSSETLYDNVAIKPLHCSFSSYALGRPSARNTTQSQSLPPPSGGSNVQQNGVRQDNVSDLPADASSRLPLIQPRPSLSMASSAPDLTTLWENKFKRDSRLSPIQIEERPHSIVADLPPPSTWVPERVSGQRTSFILTTSQQSNTRMSSQSTARNSTTYRARRTSVQSFNLPLKVNPTLPTGQPPRSGSVRSSRTSSIDNTFSPVPIVRTLCAKVDPSNTVHIAPSAVPARASSVLTGGLPKAPGRLRTQSVRLSLFPTALPSPPRTSPPALVAAEAMRRSSSATTLSHQLLAAQAQPQRLLRRPTSLQIRSDHAPFLRSMRSPTFGPPLAILPADAPSSRPFPIRTLKPSRSSTHVPFQTASPMLPLIDTSQYSSTGSPPAKPSTTPHPEAAEEADISTPLISPGLGPPVPAPSSARQSCRLSRRVKSRPSIPELDFGIPVVGLGPPAPPPTVPLPSLPPASRPTSPLGPSMGMNGLTGLGIRV